MLNRRIPEKIKYLKNRSSIFIDLACSQESKNENSYYNTGEAIAVEQLLYRIYREDITIGVITPYQAQTKTIMKRL